MINKKNTVDADCREEKHAGLRSQAQTMGVVVDLQASAFFWKGGGRSGAAPVRCAGLPVLSISKSKELANLNSVKQL